MMLCFVPVHLKTYKPCELAQEMYLLIDEKVKSTIDNPEHPFARAAVQYLEDLPLLVCIAGYHNFSTEFTYTVRDGKRHDGIFGIVPDPNTGESYLDDDLNDDFWALINNVLYIGYYRNTLAHNFYSQLCIPRQSARPTYCYLNKYVFGSYQVLVPKNRQLLRDTYQDPHKN